MKTYHPNQFESKWCDIWDKNKTYCIDFDSKKPKYVAMSMFNYPSGKIHIGHAMNYTISDVKSRFKRQQGFESYLPVGWDAFGMPAENYAIKTGISPQESMKNIIPDYHKQYKMMGWSNDWSKEITTCESNYYKWTQWLFTELYKHDLVYQDTRMQWWCSKCQTVLANEQVINNKCWRHDSVDDLEVEKKEIKQWFFKILDYAEELLESTDDLDWTETVKIAQKNWIGKSSGAEIVFNIEGENVDIKVFTTRPDTIFGATFLILSPEHELTEAITMPQAKKKMGEYVKKSITKTDIERQAENKDKSGVFTGRYAINPINNKKIPIWVADYVLNGYGTGAIMGVPAHDERDKEFADKYKLQIIKVLDINKSNNEVLINSDIFNNLQVSTAKEKIIEFLHKNNAGHKTINYKLRDWSVSRQRYWGAPIPIIYCPDHGAVIVPDDQLPVELPIIEDYAPSGDGSSTLSRATDWINTPCPKCGKPSQRDTDTLDTYVCSSWYELRYFDPNNSQQAFNPEVTNKWMPVDFYNGGDHVTAHLIYVRFIAHFLHRIGILDNPEPFKQFLYNGKVTAGDGTMFSKSKGNGVDPLEIINQGYGADALRMYLMFAAPLEQWIKWDVKGVPAMHKFLSRVWRISQEYMESKAVEMSEESKTAIYRSVNLMTQKVTDDLEKNNYNTAISAIMTCLNVLYLEKNKAFGKNTVWKEAIESLLCCLAPFAPFITEELWNQLGNLDSIHINHWPKINSKYLVNTTTEYAIQVNGKLRSLVIVDSDSLESDVINSAKKDEKIMSHLEGKTIKKTIFVPNKIVNFVI